MERGRGKGAVLTLRTVAETGSTNADLLDLASQGANEGTWLIADRQTSGRGRQGRAWASPVGNFHGSTLIRLRPGDPPAATLALVAGVALDDAARTFAPAGTVLMLKWPNDLVSGEAKLAGILLERAADAVVAGIGVNLAHSPALPDRPATSFAALGHAVDRDVFAGTLAEAFARWLSRWRGEGLTPVRARWIERAHPVGTALAARLADGVPLTGLFDGLDENGALILRLAGGERRVIHAADVFLV